MVLINPNLAFQMVSIEPHLLVGIGVNEDIVPSSNWTGSLNNNRRNFLLRVSSAKGTQCRRLSSSVYDLSLKHSVWERPLSTMAARLDYEFGPH